MAVIINTIQQKIRDMFKVLNYVHITRIILCVCVCTARLMYAADNQAGSMTHHTSQLVHPHVELRSTLGTGVCPTPSPVPHHIAPFVDLCGISPSASQRANLQSPEFPSYMKDGARRETMVRRHYHWPTHAFSVETQTIRKSEQKFEYITRNGKQQLNKEILQSMQFKGNAICTAGRKTGSTIYTLFI